MQGRGDEFVDFIADLPGHAQGNGRRPNLGETAGIEECLLQRIVGDRAGQVITTTGIFLKGIDGFAQLRVTETECCLAVFERNIGVDARVISHELW
ncbi:hypothetical protein D3C84_955120 [compost metagenome]